VNPILAAAPLNHFFLAQSPSTSPPAAAHLGKFPSFLAKIIKWLLFHAWLGWIQPKKKKEKEREWAGSGF